MARTRFLLDTGPLVALLDTRDQWSRWSREAVSTLPAPFETCESVISEAHFLLSARTHDGGWRLNQLIERGRLKISFSFAEHQTEVFALMKRFEEVPMSFADACLVRMAEQAPSRIITTDGGFERYRTSHRKRLSLVMP